MICTDSLIGPGPLATCGNLLLERDVCIDGIVQTALQIPLTLTLNSMKMERLVTRALNTQCLLKVLLKVLL